MFPQSTLSSVRRQAGFVLAVAACCGCGANRVTAPQSYAPFVSHDKVFECTYPAAWELVAGGSPGIVSRASFRSGTAKIEVVADLKGSLMGDIAKASGSMLAGLAHDAAGIESPVGIVHDFERNRIMAERPNYEELLGQVIHSRMGEGRESEFTEPGLLGRKTKGYRVTFLSNDRRITVTCQCAEADWETLQPAFHQVIDSVSPASR